MHAGQIVAQFLEAHLSVMHGARRRVLTGLVWVAMCGCALTLSKLARHMSGVNRSMKSSLKQVDRHIGHVRTKAECAQVARALLTCLCRWLSVLVIAVDWSSAAPGGAFVELRASVVWLGMGRGLTVYQQVYPAAKQGNRRAEAALLNALAQWIPKDSAVVVVTDAGFRIPWFKRVEKHGWGWIGRIRGRSKMRIGEGLWQEAMQWGHNACTKAQRQSDCQLTTHNRLPCDLVRVWRKRTGRKPYRRPGSGAICKARLEAKRSAREPWVLAHSTGLRSLRADEIVALYARRMQIEENFRDTKSLHFGMGMEIGRSRSALRLQALLLIGTLAAFLLWHIGQIAEAEGLHRKFMATTRKTRELSLITLGVQLCMHLTIPFSEQGDHALRKHLGVPA